MANTVDVTKVPSHIIGTENLDEVGRNLKFEVHEVTLDGSTHTVNLTTALEAVFFFGYCHVGAASPTNPHKVASTLNVTSAGVIPFTITGDTNTEVIRIILWGY